MPKLPQVWRLLPSAALGTGSTAAATYSINKLTSGETAWWWTIVGISLLGLIAAAPWGYRVQAHTPDGQAAQYVAAVWQTARDGGSNVSISANNQSVAACSVDTLHMGETQRGDSDRDHDRS